jgi:hypothetical protein
MEGYLKKKHILLISLSALIFVAVLGVVDANNLISCEIGMGQGTTIAYCEKVSVNLLPLIATLPLAGLFFFLRDEVFSPWVKLAKWWVPISMFLILVIPGDSSGGGWGIDIPPLDAVFALYSSGLFLVISLILIIWKSIQLRKRGV